MLQYIICNLLPASQRDISFPALQMQKQRVPETQHGKASGVELPLITPGCPT